MIECAIGVDADAWSLYAGRFLRPDWLAWWSNGRISKLDRRKSDCIAAWSILGHLALLRGKCSVKEMCARSPFEQVFIQWGESAASLILREDFIKGNKPKEDH